MNALQSYVLDVMRQPVDPRLAALAQKIASQHEGTLAVIAYGSVFRGVKLEDTLADFYVVTENSKGLSYNAIGRMFGQVLPPNVFYFEADGLRSKYAVVALAQFKSWNAGASNPYFWARFSQPVRLVFCINQKVETVVLETIVTALQTANANALSLSTDPVQRWTQLYAETYRTELRPESTTRATSVVAANEDFYRRISASLPNTAAPAVKWAARRMQGKLLSVARLIKSAFTFQGGAEYAAWKIERHTGQRIVLSAWQKRHPVIAGLMLLPKLLRKGMIK